MIGGTIKRTYIVSYISLTGNWLASGSSGTIYIELDPNSSVGCSSTGIGLAINYSASPILEKTATYHI